MASQVSLTSLYALIKERFVIRWHIGKEYGNRNILSEVNWGNHPNLIGYLSVIRPSIIQVIGVDEINFLNKLSEAELVNTLSQAFDTMTHVVIVTDGCPISASLRQVCKDKQTALFRCKVSAENLITDLRYRLSTQFTEKQILHGVFMEVNSLGVLIQGESRIGKSELALELISRGHRLIADDAPEFALLTPDIISGSCPSLLQDLLEVRGLGVLNIREMYGDNAIKSNKFLKLIIHLFHDDSGNADEPRLKTHLQQRDILNVAVPEIAIRVAPGRNMAVLIEAAVRNHMITLRGRNSNDEFIQRQQKYLDKNLGAN